jgi:hypothetical protein
MIATIAVPTPAWQRSARRATTEHPWDAAAWKRLLRAAQARTIDEARPVYDEVVERFPTSSLAWSIYVEHAMKDAATATAVAAAGEGAAAASDVDTLFTRCLVGADGLFADARMWCIYVRYIRETRIDAVRRAGGESAALASAHEEMRAAFNLATKSVGAAYTAGNLWRAFVAYELQRHDLGGFTNRGEIRKVYHRALSVPHGATHELWAQYQAFEAEGKNPARGAAMVKEWTPKVLPIRAAADALQRLWSGIDVELLATPPECAPREQAAQLALWRAVIAHERTNPLKLQARDELEARIRLVTNRALCCARFIPELWFDAAVWEQRAASLDAGHWVPPSDDALERAAHVLERAAKVSVLLCTVTLYANLAHSLLAPPNIFEGPPRLSRNRICARLGARAVKRPRAAPRVLRSAPRRHQRGGRGGGECTREGKCGEGGEGRERGEERSAPQGEGKGEGRAGGGGGERRRRGCRRGGGHGRGGRQVPRLHRVPARGAADGERRCGARHL